MQIAIHFDLPDAHHLAIGKIITRWAYFEFTIKSIIGEMVGLDTAVARIALRTPRVSEQIDMIADIRRVQSRSAAFDWSSLRAEVALIESFRDKVSHNPWITRDGVSEPLMYDFSKSRIAHTPKGHKAKIDPLQVRVPIEVLEQIITRLDRVIGLLPTIRESALVSPRP